MTPENPYRVTTPEGKVALIFSNVADGVPLHVGIRCGDARGILRFAGTTSWTTSAEDQARLQRFMESVFFGCGMENVVLMSGATRVLDADYQTVNTVLELPALIRGWCPSCRTLGSVPRTTPTMSLVENSRFVPSDKLDARVLIHPGLDAAWIVQLNASETRDDYSLDIPLYFDHMDDMREENRRTGLIVWGGGNITAQEVREAITRQHPVAIIAGSGRFADSLVAWRSHNFGDLNRVFRPILEQWQAEGVDALRPSVIHTPQQLRNWLLIHGFLDRS